MRSSVASAVTVAKGNPAGLADEPQANSLGLDENLRYLLRKAIEESGWKHDAVAASISAATGLTIDGVYLSKMLSGDKGLSAKHLVGLPDEVECIFARLYAESFGLIVVAPVSGPDAVKQFTAGLFGLLSGTAALPAKAGAPLKASLPTADRKRA